MDEGESGEKLRLPDELFDTPVLCQSFHSAMKSWSLAEGTFMIARAVLLLGIILATAGAFMREGVAAAFMLLLSVAAVGAAWWAHKQMDYAGEWLQEIVDEALRMEGKGRVLIIREASRAKRTGRNGKGEAKE